MPRLSMAEMELVEPRWPENSYGIEAPEWCCGDYDCECADRARKIMTDGEYQLAFGVPKEFGLDPEEAGTSVTMTEGYGPPPLR
jgi:hypothetical protein